jgi:hypothetical protein
MRPRILTHGPREVLGYRKNGTPIFPIAGASGGNEPAGNTITVPPLPVPVPVEPPPTQQNGGVQTFTAADIEAARKQEKDKLYGKITEQEERLKKIEADTQARLAAEEKARKDAEAAAEAERVKNLSFEQKLEETQQAWSAQMSDLQSQIAQRDALLERERQFQLLNEHRARRLAEESDNIMPELHSWVAGNSIEEIDANVSRAIETTGNILSQVTQAQQEQASAYQQARQQARGTGVTAPPVGPMENQSGQETFTAEQISNMDMATYMKNRGRLLEAASQQVRGR